MKSLYSLKKFGLALVAMTLMLTAVNAQQRYKHVPRVKIEKTPREAAIVKETNANNTTTAQMNRVEENNVAVTEPTIPVIENNTTVASTENVMVAETKTKSVVNHKKMVKTKRTADKGMFTKTVKENSKLMHVKDVKKAALQRWLMLMIIFCAVGLLLIILAVVFSYALWGFYSIALIFYIVGALMITAGLVFLVLGLTGVMS